MSSKSESKFSFGPTSPISAQNLLKQGDKLDSPERPKKIKPPLPTKPSPLQPPTCVCGQTIKATHSFCQSCGSPNPRPVEPHPHTPTEGASLAGPFRAKGLRPWSDSYDTSGLMQSNTNLSTLRSKIDYSASTPRLMTDWEFKGDPYNILDLFREGVFAAVCQRCRNVLEKCSSEQFSKLIPMVALGVALTPAWAEKGAEPILQIIRARVAADPMVAQAMSCLKSSRLLNGYAWGFNSWPDTISCSSGLPELLRTVMDQEVGYKLTLDGDKQTLLHPFRNGRIVEIAVSKVFNSNAKPLLLSVTCLVNGARVEAPIILKGGDDLRQDVSCLHVQNFMNNLWRSVGLQHDGLPVETLVYGVLAVDENLGCIEFVPHAMPLRTCKELVGCFTPKALNRLITTAAGSFMAAYILGVRDRHFDNVLISKQDGSLFHIDFGHILGDECAVDTGAFAVTSDLKLVITNLGEQGWATFLELCIQAFKIVRDHHRVVIAFASVAMAPFMQPDSVRTFIAHRLRLEFEEQVAIDKMRRKLELAPTRLKTRFKNVVHGFATGDVFN